MDLGALTTLVGTLVLAIVGLAGASVLRRRNDDETRLPRCERCRSTTTRLTRCSYCGFRLHLHGLSGHGRRRATIACAFAIALILPLLGPLAVDVPERTTIAIATLALGTLAIGIVLGASRLRSAARAELATKAACGECLHPIAVPREGLDERCSECGAYYAMSGIVAARHTRASASAWRVTARIAAATCGAIVATALVAHAPLPTERLAVAGLIQVPWSGTNETRTITVARGVRAWWTPLYPGRWDVERADVDAYLATSIIDLMPPWIEHSAPLMVGAGLPVQYERRMLRWPSMHRWSYRRAGAPLARLTDTLGTTSDPALLSDSLAGQGDLTLRAVALFPRSRVRLAFDTLLILTVVGVIGAGSAARVFRPPTG